jgi:UDP-galactopyranose mutase
MTRIGTLRRHRSERAPLFRSFWMAGFDGAEHAGAMRLPLHADDLSQYRRRVEADYRAVCDAGIACVRESIDWRRVSRGGRFDFTRVAVRTECARRAGLQIAWTLCHAGGPDDVDVCSQSFVDRFRAFAKAAACVIAQCGDAEAPVYTPVNEISFLSWALAETGLFREQRRDLRNRGHELRRQLVRAALAACDAILEVEPRARFLHTDSVIDVPRADAAVGRDLSFATWDMLAGRLEPGLGGHPRYLDVVGVHCHYGNPPWRGAADSAGERPANACRVALHRWLCDVHARYGRPLVVCETNYVSAARAAWLRDIGNEIGEALVQGVPVQGACVCRAVERPAWEDPRYWRGRRLWDALLQPGGEMPRVPGSAYGQALRDVQARIEPLLADPHRRALR